MQDRFKFRGRTSLGVWIYGYLYNYQGKLYIRDDDEIGYAVKPETIGQCIGLKDNNGKFIYEGDIVRTSYPYAVKNYEVKWGDCCWELRKEKGFIVLYEKISEALEVIGNIHENADLLENKDE